MKMLYLIVPALLLTGCGTVYKYTENIPETGRVKHTRAQTVKGQNTCIRTENHLELDTLTGTVQYKETLRFDCKGGTEVLVACKKWQRQDGKLVKLKTACGKKRDF